MKKVPLLLAVSLAANAVLLGVYFTRSPAARARPGPPVDSMPTKAVRVGGGRNLRTPPATPERVTALLKEPINTSEAKDLMARMRAAGFPEELLRATAQTRLVAQYQARSAEILGANQPVPPFWDTEASYGTDPAQQAALLKLNRQMTDAMKDLLGPDYAMSGLSDEARATYQRTYGDIPPEKILQIQEIMQDAYLKQMTEIYDKTVGGYNVWLPEDSARLAAIEQERRAAIVAALTPEELERYDMRASNAAAGLRNQLMAFEPTEDEFRALFRLQQAFEEKFPSSAGVSLNPDAIRERVIAEQQLRDDMAAALSPDRAAYYRIATEGGASAVARIVSRLDLPMSTVAQVMTVQREIQAQANGVRTDPTLSPEARNQALAALQQQANARVASHIGANGLAAY